MENKNELIPEEDVTDVVVEETPSTEDNHLVDRTFDVVEKVGPIAIVCYFFYSVLDLIMGHGYGVDYESKADGSKKVSVHKENEANDEDSDE
ncbi:hypothetical protein [Butyrivibrio sp. XPD2002]|uniref:hypothetical protein n=1 Tax=Butyrivibrio sp. XPD2002 TaxID=1280665 RepID=UPI000424EB45|nr:hypothetical protein [Butyrivibrio sp. XPD2002]